MTIDRCSITYPPWWHISLQWHQACKIPLLWKVITADRTSHLAHCTQTHTPHKHTQHTHTHPPTHQRNNETSCQLKCMFLDHHILQQAREHTNSPCNSNRPATKKGQWDPYLDFHWSLTRRSLSSFQQEKIVQHSMRPTKINNKRKQVHIPNKQATIRTFSISISYLPCLPLSTLRMSCPCARMACIYCGGLQHRKMVNRQICIQCGG